MRLGLLGLFALAACYEPPNTDETCTITCTAGVPDNCPGDLACESGYCVGPGQVCRPSFVSTTAGTGFACAIDAQGAVWCWGSLTQTAIATRIDATRRWDKLDAGGGHVCGIANGALFCWGENDNREVSGAVVGDVTEPLEIFAPDATVWTDVSAGADYTCGIADGRPYCWGLNLTGQLGDGTTTDSGVPQGIPTTVTDWTSIAAGDAHTCAVSTGGGVFCWGRNVRGELGPNAALSTGPSSPVAVTIGGAPLLANDVAVGYQSSCAIRAGEVLCWGLNSSGQLGDRTLHDPSTVPESAEPLRATDVMGFTKIEGARQRYCALTGETVYCWGEALAGGMGQGLWLDTRAYGITIAAGARDISVGWSRNPITNDNDLDLGCAIVGDAAQCWGDNRFGQLGRGTQTLALAPTEISGGRTWLDLSAGAVHACGIASDQTLHCWGSTERGQATGFVYGNASPRTPCARNPTDETQPLCDVGEPRALSYAPNPKNVTTGNAFTCALSNGVVSCWGSGIGTGTALKRDIAQPGGAMWRSLYDTGRDGQCGVAEASMSPTYCFGNVLSNNAAPARVAQLDGFTALALGGNPAFGVFLDPAGALYGFGDNTRYQMGDGTLTSYPALMAIGRTYTAISTRFDFVCGIRASDQKVECWGDNDWGQTGDATAVTTATPNEVPGLLACIAIATGDDHACAVCEGAIQCWGRNGSGQLAAPPTADPNPVPRFIPLMLPGDPWVELIAGARFTCARSEAGHAYCWGLGDHGQLGIGATGANLPMPVMASQID